MGEHHPRGTRDGGAAAREKGEHARVRHASIELKWDNVVLAYGAAAAGERGERKRKWECIK